MKLKNVILLCGISVVSCGNTFAYSPYANTIKQNIQPKSFLGIASFPQTAADASFVQRVENKFEGYKPYFNRSAFADMTIEEQDELENMAYRAELQRGHAARTLPHDEFCIQDPLDSENCSEGDVPSTIQTPQ